MTHSRLDLKFYILLIKVLLKLQWSEANKRNVIRFARSEFRTESVAGGTCKNQRRWSAFFVRNGKSDLFEFEPN